MRDNFGGLAIGESRGAQITGARALWLLLSLGPQYVTFLAPRIWRLLPEFLKICTPLDDRILILILKKFFLIYIELICFRKSPLTHLVFELLHEISGSIKDSGFRDQPCNYKLVKTDSAPWLVNGKI